MHCLSTKCELHELSKRANSELLSSLLSAPDFRPQARCVFACLPGNTNMHPKMCWDLVSIAEVESASLWLLCCLVAKTRWLFPGDYYNTGDYYDHFSDTNFLKKRWTRHLQPNFFPHPWPQGKEAANADSWERWSSNTSLDLPKPSCFASQ